MMRLLIKGTGEIKEQDVYLADIPTITPDGTFVIDGLERAFTIDWINSRSLDNSPIDRSLDILKSTAIKRMSRISFENVTPSRLIDNGPLAVGIAEFFRDSHTS